MATQSVSEEELTKLLQDEAMSIPDLNIAISGFAGRFPKADSLNEFEQNLLKGVDMINDNDDSRFECGLWGLPKRAGRLKDLSKFDCEFFGYNLDQANYIDYQLRILYEVVYESIMDSGVNPASLRGTNTGVYFGLHCNEFENAMADDPTFKSNGYYAQFGVKVAQYFDLRGLNVTFDAACASGFVGFHNAAQDLHKGLIDQAIVCSSNIPIHPTGSFIFLQMQMLSPTGYSRFLDSRADGYVKSEACVSVFLQRKDVALRNYASIVTTMTSVDGYKKEGITFPSSKSQELLIRAAKEGGHYSTNHIEYVEAHGTGTPAGDPQEAEAIANVFFPTNNRRRSVNMFREGQEKELEGEDTIDERKIGPLLVGSVKTNMGHSEAASGLCALAKVVLMLENELIYKSLHYAQPNNNIEALMDGKLKFVEETMDLKSKIVPLSCYGFGGSNVHVVVRANERPIIDEDDDGLLVNDDEIPRLIVMFGRTEEAINSFFDNIMDQESRYTRNCLTEDFLSLVDRLNSGKIDRLMNHRGFLIVDKKMKGNSTRTELARGIGRCDFEPKRQNEGKFFDIGRMMHIQEHKERECNLILPGLGCQRPAMAAGLRSYKPFWSTIERLANLMEPFKSEVDLIKLLIDQETRIETSMANLFVSIVAYEIALINLICNQLQVNNLAKVVGHSLGEISCAYAVGLFDERETIMLAFRLGKCLDDNKHLIEGKMVALAMNEQDATKIIKAHKSIRVSCVNGPQSVTISGSIEEMDHLCAKLKQLDIFMKPIESCSIALHNETIMTEKISKLLKDTLINVFNPGTDYDRTKTSWISSVYGLPEDIAKQANAEYFAESLCRKVDFLGSLEKLADNSITLELAPTGIFESQLRQVNQSSTTNSNGKQAKFNYVKLMKGSIEPDEQQLDLIKGIGSLYMAGATFNNLTQFHSQYRAKKEIEFPVRRQTPSISSLMRWDHSKTLFVPRYPQQFSRSSSKTEMPIDILDDRDKYAADHCIEGRVLFPATGYLFLMWRAFSFTKRKVFDAIFQNAEKELVPIEFHNVRLFRAIILNGGRTTEIHCHFEEATGRFEIKEGGSVVAEAFARSPQENPDGLLYEQVKERIKGENLDLTIDANDIYKQFRVSGYDYGKEFQNILNSSADGRYCRIKYNGHFIAFTDSVLQTIFLAVSEYAPSGGLFLPTCFEYVRLQPKMILKKIHEAKVIFDKSASALDVQAKRDMMTKMMQKETGDKNALVETETPEKVEDDETKASAEDEKEPECIFETYCDPITGIIISDGIEMRGIKAMPAPRRFDNNEVLLESYQFVHDIEDPINDDRLTKFNQTIAKYVEVCNSMSMSLLAKLCDKNSIRQLNGLCMKYLDNKSYSSEAIKQYNEKNLTSLYKINRGTEGEDEEPYDVKKNGDYMLLSILDQLKDLEDVESVRKVIASARNHLLHDLIQKTFHNERFTRSILELALENVCTKKMRLKLIEINVDDDLMHEPICVILQSIEPTLKIDYTLAHPDINRLEADKILRESDQNKPKTYQITEPSELLKKLQLKDFDLVLYKDISCYSLTNQHAMRKIEQNNDDIEAIISSFNDVLNVGGFGMIILRQKLTLAEQILLATCDSNGDDTILSNISKINNGFEARYERIMLEANRFGLFYVAKKSDFNGCTMLVFRKLAAMSEEHMNKSLHSMGMVESETSMPKESDGKVVLRVVHDNEEQIAQWLESLKENFAKPVEPSKEDDQKDDESKTKEDTDAGDDKHKTEHKDKEKEKEPEKQQEEEEKEPEKQVMRTVWLCAVATKQKPISGLIGMMQALRKELGSARLRCYYDCHTFKDQDEPIEVADIEACEKFQLSLKRNLIWNCIDSSGQFGSFRHFTINDYLSYDKYACDKQVVISDTKQDETISTNDVDSDNKTLVEYGHINFAIRGDLSSFAWFESPYKYLSNDERQDGMVKVAYCALNFRDIMLATGRLPLDAVPIQVAMSDCMIGLEFSGVDMNNKRYMCMVSSRGLATHAYCAKNASIKVEIPEYMSLKEAATIPVVYATVILALICRGHMKKGESVLIHAGSGGVGQAAIRLASYYGVKVFTTVGTDEKRKFLLEEFPDCLSDEQIFSSRDCIFEEKIMHLTEGKGVDLVLNSLADDKLQASIRCLADGGRFLEIGKYDLAMNTPLELLKLDTNKTFHGILLDKLFEADENNVSSYFKDQLKSVANIIKDGLQKGYVRPIKHTVFKRNQIEEAFRFMATGKHIGKILIEIDNPIEKENDDKKSSNLLNTSIYTPQLNVRAVPRFQLSPYKSYIITGGLGGFGMELIKWLVKQGARHILITSRAGIKTGYQKVTLNRLENNLKCKFLIVDNKMADTTTLEGVEKLCKLALDESPSGEIGGLFHLAMVLKDTLLENMSVEDFMLVCRPKVDTCMYLDKVTRSNGLKLDYFVVFSSVTSGKGNAGQSNYAYANSCIERICEQRRKDKLHGLAIQWGAIGDVGVAYENLGGNDVIIGGTVPQRIPSCFNTLGKLLCSPFSICLSVVPVNRSGMGPGGEKGDLVAAVMHVLGIKDPSKVAETATLGELGLDSLMAVEIRQYIEREYDMTLNIQEIRSLTIAKIREINDGERPTKASVSQEAKGDEENKVRVVENYGTSNKDEKSETSTPSSDNKNTATSKTKTNDKVAKKVVRSPPNKSEMIESFIEKEMIASFQPQLKLPESDYHRLNSKHNTQENKMRLNTYKSPKIQGIRRLVSPTQPPANGKQTTNGHNKNGTNGTNGHANGTNGHANGHTNGKSDKNGINGNQKIPNDNLDDDVTIADLDIDNDIKRPIFFVPPIHGEFDRLEVVSSMIKRPCIGLNWTRRVGRVESIQEAAEVYLDLLKRTDWSHEFGLDNEGEDGERKEDGNEKDRVVDLVGYSFGATVAFEMMLTLYKWQKRAERRLASGLSDNITGGLRPGRLILLDGSPKQIELGSKLMANWTQKKPLKLGEKLDELLLVYVVSHTRNMKVNYEEFQKNLVQSQLEDKIFYASEQLVKVLDAHKAWPNETIDGMISNDEKTTLENKSSSDKATVIKRDLAEEEEEREERRNQVSHAIEAFCRRYELISRYKTNSILGSDVTLIRAEKNYLRDQGQEEKFNEDYNLGSLINGKVDLFIMKGDHETFLNNNARTIGSIIMNGCSRSNTPLSRSPSPLEVKDGPVEVES